MKPRIPAAGLALLLGLGSVALPAFADIEPPEDAVPVVGMAFDPQDGGIWLAGPRADRGVMINSDGREVSFSGDPESVQGLAWSGDRLWIADIGDAEQEREFVVVFRLGSVAEATSTYHAFDFQYEDGPQDAQAFMISGRGRIYVATTGDDPGIYRAELEPSRETMNTLYRVADAPEGVTDGAFLTDGSTMALRTATGIEYVDAFSWETLLTDTIVGGPEGESITVGLEDEIYVGGNPTIREAAVPSSDTTTTLAPSPSPSPTPSPTPSAGETPSVAPSETTYIVEERTTGPSRTGTLVALIIAGAVAVVAGVATFLLKR